MIRIFKTSALLLILAVSPSLLAQESLRSVQTNRVLKNKATSYKTGQAPLALPFIDDFSGGGLYPDPLKWQDSYGYVNQSFGDNSPGIGILTLDAMDANGAIYSRANSSGFIADYLTSQPINLDLGGDTTVYLSFFYQPQGLGDAPESRDSLVLEFFAAELNRWVWIWSKAGSPNKAFEQVLIPVRGALFLNENFRFRFKNYASLANAYENSLIANADHWHIDYIYLNRGRYYQDFFPEDLCIQRNTGSLLLNYQAMPWQHFKLATINEVTTIFPVHLRNLSNTTRFFEPVFTITDDYGSTQGFTKNLIADEIAAYQELNYDATFNYGFSSDAADSAQFSITLDLKPVATDLIPGNTRAVYQQVFKDYYAYDDGSAENGYGVVGEGATNALIAVRFENFNPGDSLKGISIFFNRSYADANQKYFQLAIWNEQNGQPGELLYSQAGARASTDGGLTGFDYFPLDTAQVVPGVFYAGIKQVTADFLNIGFDKNNHHAETLFYQTEIDWKPTSFQGSLMLRPVFANKSKKTGIEQTPDSPFSNEFRCYPNPTSGWMNFELPDHLNEPRIRIINIQGAVVLDESLTSRRIDTADWPSGHYFIVVTHRQGSLLSRFIKL